MGPPLRLKGTTLIIRTVPLIRHASRDTFPQGKAILHRERWLGQARRRCGTAPAAIFHKPRAQWPGGDSDTYSNFARRKDSACSKG